VTNLPPAAPATTAPTYITQATEATLPNSRKLVAGSNVTLTDAGAGSTLTVASTASGTPAGAPPQVVGYSATNTGEAETVSGDCVFTRTGTNAYGITCAAVNPAVATRVATTTVLPFSPAYLNGAAGIGATLISTSFGALTVDGVTVAVNDRVLVKNQSSSFQNGVYIVTATGSGAAFYTLTRALDYDQSSDITSTGTVPVIAGTANAGTSWLLTSAVVTVGTDALTYTQFTYSLANTPSLNGTNAFTGTNTFSIALNAGALPNPTASTLGGVESLAPVTSKWVNTISTSGVPSATQPAFTDISGTAATSQMPALNTCTDYPAPGAFAPTWTAGHTYCMGAGTYTVAAAQTVNVANVTVLCTSKAAIIQRTGTTDLFDASAANFQLIDCKIDGNSSASSGPLVNLTGSNALIADNTFINLGVTTSNLGAIIIQNGNDNVIRYNVFPSATDTSIDVAPSGTNSVDRAIVDWNIIDACAPATALSCIRINDAGDSAASRIHNLAITNNSVVATTVGAQPFLLTTTSIAFDHIPQGVNFSHNKAYQTVAATGAGLIHLFGLRHALVNDNEIQDGGSTITQAAILLGDVYDSTISLNSIDVGTGQASGIDCADCDRNVFSNNTIYHVANGKIGIQIDDQSAPVSDNIITNNNVSLFPAGGGGTCFQIQASHAQTVNDNSITNNHCVGDTSTSQIGVGILDSSGTVSSTIVANNQLSHLATGISVGAGATSTNLGLNTYDVVTTPISDAGTSTSFLNPFFAPLFNTTAVTAAANSAAIQNLMTLPIPAQGMNVIGKTTEFVGSGTYTTGATNGTGTLTFTIRACTVAGCATGTVVNLNVYGPTIATTVSTTSADPWNIQMFCTTVAVGASGTLMCNGNANITFGTTGTAAAGVYQAVVTGTVTVDLTVAENVQFSITDSLANASNSFIMRQELINPFN